MKILALLTITTILLSVFFSCIIQANVLDGRVSLKEKKVSISTAEAEKLDFPIKPDRLYFLKYQIRKVYEKTNFITYKVKVDTLSSWKAWQD